jgi:hemerythrin
VIDQQHRQLADSINRLFEAYASGQSRKTLGKLINELVDLATYHFGYEESLQEKAGYSFAEAHKKTHVRLAGHMADYQARFEKGEDIFKDADSLLGNWLFDHLKHDDADYVASAKEYLRHNPVPGTGKGGLMARLFR